MSQVSNGMLTNADIFIIIIISVFQRPDRKFQMEPEHTQIFYHILLLIFILNH